MADPASQPQPDPQQDPRRTGAKSAPVSPAVEPGDTELDDDQAAKALEKIEEVRQKLEPRG